jgi:hypothetical protein
LIILRIAVTRPRKTAQMNVSKIKKCEAILTLLTKSASCPQAMNAWSLSAQSAHQARDTARSRAISRSWQRIFTAFYSFGRHEISIYCYKKYSKLSYFTFPTMVVIKKPSSILKAFCSQS